MTGAKSQKSGLRKARPPTSSIETCGELADFHFFEDDVVRPLVCSGATPGDFVEGYGNAFPSYREPLHSWNHFHLNRLSRGLVDMYRCPIGFKFRDEVRIHVSKGLEAVPTEQLVIPWGDSHHREPAVLIGFRYSVRDPACSWGRPRKNCPATANGKRPFVGCGRCHRCPDRFHGHGCRDSATTLRVASTRRGPTQRSCTPVRFRIVAVNRNRIWICAGAEGGAVRSLRHVEAGWPRNGQGPSSYAARPHHCGGRTHVSTSGRHRPDDPKSA